MRAASHGRTRLFIQLIDFLNIRRRPEPGKFFARILQVTPAHRAALGDPDLSEAEVRARLAALSEAELARVLTEREWEALRFGYRERVGDVEHAHIRELPQVLPGLFADAAARAEKAGFDGVELHYAHAYTMASFLSRTNTRTDGYGGAVENRARLPLEVLRRCARGSATVSPSAAVFWRRDASTAVTASTMRSISASPSRAPAWIFFPPRVAASSTTPNSPAIGSAAYPYTGRSGYECMPQYISDARGPFGRNAAATAAIRQAVRAAGFEVPVVLYRRHPQFRDGGRVFGARRLRHRRRGAPVARRSRLVSQDPARPSAAMFVCVSSPIIAKASIRSTRR